MYVESRYFCLSLSQKFPKIDLSNNDIFHSICFFRGISLFRHRKNFRKWCNDRTRAVSNPCAILPRRISIDILHCGNFHRATTKDTDLPFLRISPQQKFSGNDTFHFNNSDNKLTPSFFSFFFRYRKTFKYETRDLSRIRRGLRNLLTRGMGRKQQGRTF